MAWTAPRTWVTGELVTAAILNTYIKDNQIALDTFLANQDLTANRILIGQGTSAIAATGDATLNGDLTVVGTGPHVIGGSTDDFTRLNLDGAFTSGGSSTTAYGTHHDGALTGHSGDSDALVGTKMTNNIVTTGNCTTIAQLWVSEPQITVGSGTVTNSASLYVEGAATEATNDHALWVDDGNVLLDDTLICRGHVLFGPGTSALSELHVISASGGSFVRIDSVEDTSDTGIEMYKAGVRKWECVNDSSGAASGDALVFKPAGTTKFTFEQSGNLTITGALSKGSGSFNIPHPLPVKSETHRLVHSFIEGPQCDLIYRGSATLVAGSATVNLDTASNMTEGTWVLLCRDEQCFTSNETGWSSVRGSVSGNILTIECEDATSTDTLSWMVVAERHDDHILDTDWTDADGHVIIEPEVQEVPDEEDD